MVRLAPRAASYGVERTASIGAHRPKHWRTPETTGTTPVYDHCPDGAQGVASITVESKKTETVCITIPLDTMWGEGRLVWRPSRFSGDKPELERYIVDEFRKLVAPQSISIDNIRSSPDDSHGGPDVLATLGDAEIGIQVTELKFEHRPKAARVARQLAVKLLAQVLKRVRPSRPVMVSIHSTGDSENKILRLNQREMKNLAETISNAIAHDLPENPQSLSPMNMIYVSPPTSLANRVSYISLHVLLPGHTAYCPTKDMLSVTFRFHSVRSSKSTILRVVRDLAARKAHTRCDLLLVWYQDRDFWGNGDMIAQALIECLEHVPAKASFLLGFEDFEEVKKLYPLTGHVA